MLTTTCTENAREDEDEELFVFLTSQGFAKCKKSLEFKSSWRRSLWAAHSCPAKNFIAFIQEHNEQNAIPYFAKKEKRS